MHALRCEVYVDAHGHFLFTFFFVLEPAGPTGAARPLQPLGLRGDSVGGRAGPDRELHQCRDDTHRLLGAVPGYHRWVSGSGKRGVVAAEIETTTNTDIELCEYRGEDDVFGCLCMLLVWYIYAYTFLFPGQPVRRSRTRKFITTAFHLSFI